MRRLVSNYIAREDTFILAVTAANVDVAVSEAIKRAREVDPQGRRTLGVITKVDTRERDGSDMEQLIRVLQNRELPLKKGYVAIKNRSKRQMEEGMSAEDAAKVTRSSIVIVFSTRNYFPIFFPIENDLRRQEGMLANFLCKT